MLEEKRKSNKKEFYEIWVIDLPVSGQEVELEADCLNFRFVVVPTIGSYSRQKELDPSSISPMI